MKWKQFLTPVKSMNNVQAQQFLAKAPHGSVTLLDVRQPGEYEAGHIPGAQLIPLSEIKERLGEIDPDKPAVVYCAIGGRSRVAAQILSGENFTEVYNMSGGFKAWQDKRAIGPEDAGLQMFDGLEDVKDVLIVAYSLEKGLQELYLSLIHRVTGEEARSLFEKLAEIEIHHQDRVFNEYCKVTGTSPHRTEFDEKIVVSAMEGGLTTDQFMQLYHPDFESTLEITTLAMSIEAQALDMYARAARIALDPESREFLNQIAREEQSHLQQLAELLDRL